MEFIELKELAALETFIASGKRLLTEDEIEARWLGLLGTERFCYFGLEGMLAVVVVEQNMHLQNLDKGPQDLYYIIPGKHW